MDTIIDLVSAVFRPFGRFFFYLFALVFGLPGILIALPFKKFKTTPQAEFENATKDAYMGIGLLFWLAMAFVYDIYGR